MILSGGGFVHGIETEIRRIKRKAKQEALKIVENLGNDLQRIKKNLVA